METETQMESVPPQSGLVPGMLLFQRTAITSIIIIIKAANIFPSAHYVSSPGLNIINAHCPTFTKASWVSSKAQRGWVNCPNHIVVNGRNEILELSLTAESELGTTRLRFLCRMAPLPQTLSRQPQCSVCLLSMNSLDPQRNRHSHG